MLKEHSIINNKNFALLLLCHFLSALGDNIPRILVITALLLTNNVTVNDFSLPSLLMLLAMPYILLPVINRKFIHYCYSSICMNKFYNILATIIIVLGLVYNWYILTLIGMFFVSLHNVFWSWQRSFSLSIYCNHKNILTAKSFFLVSTIIALLFAIIINKFYTNSIYIIVAIMLILAISSYIISFFIPKLTIAENNKITKYNLLATIKNISSNKDNLLAMLGIAYFFAMSITLLTYLPVITRETLHSSESVYLMLICLIVSGFVFGAMFCNYIFRDGLTVRFVPIAILLCGIATLDFWHSISLFSYRDFLGGIHYFLSSLKGLKCCVGVFFMAFFCGIYVIPLYAHLYNNSVESRVREIVINSNFINAILIIIIAVIVAVSLYFNLSFANIILVLGIANLLFAAYVCQILPDTIVRSLLHVILKLLYRVRIKGFENFVNAGDRVLIIANHASVIDPILLGVLLPKNFTIAIDNYIAKSWWIMPFMKLIRATTINPAHPMAAKTLIDKLKNKESVIIFPEGRVTVTGSLMKIYESPGVIADMANATLLPIRIDGTQFSLFSNQIKMRTKIFPKFRITILKAKKINIAKNITGRDRRHIIGNQLYDIMAHMMFAGSHNYSTVFASIIDASNRFGKFSKTISDINNTELSYNKIFIGSFLLGNHVQQQTKFGEKVGVLLPNMSVTVLIFFALMAHGRIPAMLNFSVGIKNILSCCKTAQLQTVYTSRVFIEKADLQQCIDYMIQQGVAIVYLEDVKQSFNIFDKLKAIYKSIRPGRSYKKYILRHSSRINPNKPAIILFTSGSEGLPKGVALSHTNIISNLQQISSRVDFGVQDKMFNALPMFHSFGLTVGTLLPLISGADLFLYPSPLHYRVIPEMIYKQDATIFLGTDTFLAGYAKYAHPYDFFNIKYVVSGGEKLKPSTQKTWLEKFSIRILEGYGTTEASPVISINTSMHYKPGSVGRTVPNIEYKLLPVKGIKNGGELAISGPNLMLGYLKADKPGIIEKVSSVIDDKKMTGWYNTGDIVNIDDDGFITIVGRTKRFAKIGGEMVSLTSVELLINKLWPEHINAVISVEDDKKGEAIILFSNNYNATKSGVQNFLKENHHSPLLLPRDIIIIDDIPLLGAGKINYPELKLYLDNNKS